MQFGSTPADEKSFSTSNGPKSGGIVIVRLFLIMLVSLLGLQAGPALGINLSFATLPSSQGWTYEPIGHPGLPEANVFSVDGTRLEMDTIGVGFGASGVAQSIRYSLHGVVDPTKPAILEWTSRTLANEENGDNTFGWAFLIQTGSREYSVGFRTNLLRAFNGNGAEEFLLDATAFHTYRIEADLIAERYSLYVDGVLALANLVPFVTNHPNGLFFGDSSNSANARAELTSFSFSQSAIPEPNTAFVMLLIGVGLGRKRRCATVIAMKSSRSRRRIRLERDRHPQ